MKLSPHEQYLLSKLSASVHDMAMSRENYKDKLRAVFLEHLEPAIREDELPESEEKSTMINMKRTLTSVEDPRFGRINASIDALSHPKAKNLCQQICDTYSSLNARAKL